MKRFSTVATFSAVLLAFAVQAQAKGAPGGDLPAPNLLSAELVTGECDGDELTVDDACVELTWVKVCGALKYPTEVTKGFDTDADTCDDTSITESSTIVAETCTGVNNCLWVTDAYTAECQTAQVPVGTSTFCVDDGDGITDCVNDPEDVLVQADSVAAKLKATNPPKKGPKSVSQSTPFSNTVYADPNDECGI